jgi:hypothetical protein
MDVREIFFWKKKLSEKNSLGRERYTAEDMYYIFT